MKRPWFGESAVIAALALLIFGGYGLGRQTGRWQPIDVPSVDLSSLSSQYAGWTATDLEIPAAEREVGGIDGYIARNYQNLESGESVTVMILTGKGGPISVHPPDICFAGRGYQRETKEERIALRAGDDSESADSTEHEFETAVFRGPASLDHHRLQLFWAWSSDGVWHAPANPRFEFARLPRVYKLYVSRTLPPAIDADDRQTCLELMKLVVADFAALTGRGGDSDQLRLSVDNAIKTTRRSIGMSPTQISPVRPSHQNFGASAI